MYAVQPPEGLAFEDTESGGTAGGAGGGDVDIIVNSSGEYSCSPPGSTGGWQCTRLATASAAGENQIFAFYTPAH